jgi:biotin/methionine sulfoxide reductase
VSRRGKVAGREAVAINPQDAARRGIVEGDVVRIFNSRGACLAGATVTDAVCPGVLRLSCGAWYDPHDDGNGDAVCAHGNPNVLTRDQGTSRLGQGPSSATVLVEIERAPAPAPPVRAFTPPQTVAATSGH